MDSTQEMAQLTLMGTLSLSRKLETGKHALSYWVLNVVNAWPTMGLLLISSLTLPRSYMKEMCRLQEMLPPGQGHAILHPSSELY